MNKDHEKIAIELKKLAKITMPAASRNSMRSNILNQIQAKPQTSPVLTYINSLKDGIKLATHRKAMIKTVLLESISLNNSPLVTLQRFWRNGWQTLRYAGAGAFVLFLITAIVFQPWQFSSTAFASENRYLQNIDSSVTILHSNGSSTHYDQAIAETINIQHNDTLEFGANTEAELKIAGGVIRFAPHSKAQITIHNEDTTINLLTGAAWFNVTKLDKDIDLTVKTNGITLLPQTAIFDLKSKEFTRIISIEGNINGVIENSKQLIPITILAERTLKFRPKTPTDYYQQLEFSDFQLPEEDKSRIRDNLQKDISFNQELINEIISYKKQKVGATPDQPIQYAAKQAVRSTKLAFTFNETRKAEQKAKIAQEKVIEAQVLTHNNVKEQNIEQKIANDTKIAKLLDEAQVTIDEVSETATTIEQQQPIAAQKLNDEVSNIIAESQVVINPSNAPTVEPTIDTAALPIKEPTTSIADSDELPELTETETTAITKIAPTTEPTELEEIVKDTNLTTTPTTTSIPTETQLQNQLESDGIGTFEAITTKNLNQIEVIIEPIDEGIDPLVSPTLLDQSSQIKN